MQHMLADSKWERRLQVGASARTGLKQFVIDARNRTGILTITSFFPVPTLCRSTTRIQEMHGRTTRPSCCCRILVAESALWQQDGQWSEPLDEENRALRA